MLRKVEIENPRYRFIDLFKTGAEINDTIWGTIPLTQKEREIINHKDFNRLIEINQMGVAWVSYPSARHCRFHHSLGVMFVADFLLRNIRYLRKDGKGRTIETPRLINCDFIDADIWQCFRLAALCHDIGHPPLSHVIEEGLRKNPEVIPNTKETRKDEFIKSIVGRNRYSHEKATKYKLNTKDLNKVIGSKIGDDGMSQIADLAIGEAEKFPYNLLNPIINSDLDADKLDYLKRDGFFCGFLTTYDLKDFTDAIYVTMESENDGSKPTLLINKDKIGSVNAFLYSRYREITEFHYEPEVRKASQMAIEFLIQKINSLPTDQIKAKFIVDLHMDYQDGDFWNEFHSLPNAVSVDNLRRCKTTEYKEITPLFNKGITNPLDFEDLLPAERIQVHNILCYPPSIAELQRKLRKKIKDENLIVDIRTAKPPQFSLYVRVRDDLDIPLFHISEAAKGILRDSISYLYIFFYTKSDPVPIINIDTIKKEILKVSNSTIIQYFNRTGKIFSHLTILLVMSALLSHAELELSYSDPWIVGQFELQKMIEFICGKDKNPYDHSQEKIAHPQFVKDIETLIACGLIIERRMTVNYPANIKKLTDEEKKNIKNINYLNIPRNNYQLSVYGKELALSLRNFNKGTEVSREMNKIWQNALSTQKICERYIRYFNRTSSKVEKMRSNPSSKLIILQNIRKELRKRIERNHGCYIANKYD